MIIYNVTVNVDESIHTDWLNWMQNKHVTVEEAKIQYIDIINKLMKERNIKS